MEECQCHACQVRRDFSLTKYISEVTANGLGESIQKRLTWFGVSPDLSIEDQLRDLAKFIVVEAAKQAAYAHTKMSMRHKAIEEGTVTPEEVQLLAPVTSHDLQQMANGLLSAVTMLIVGGFIDAEDFDKSFSKERAKQAHAAAQAEATADWEAANASMDPLVEQLYQQHFGNGKPTLQ